MSQNFDPYLRPELKDSAYGLASLGIIFINKIKLQELNDNNYTRKGFGILKFVSLPDGLVKKGGRGQRGHLVKFKNPEFRIHVV